MAIAFGSVGARLAHTPAGTTMNVAYPSGISAGDFLILHVSVNGGSGVSAAPSGWTLVYNETTLSNPKGGLFYKVADGSESGTLAVTLASSVTGAAVILRYTGVDTTTPLDAASTNVRNTTSGTTTVLPAITTVTANTMLIYANAANSSSATMSSGAITERMDFNSPSATGTKAGAIYEEPIAGTGSTGTRTITVSSSLANWGAMIALRPATGGGGPAYSASVAFGGSGALAATATMGASASRSFSGSGTLTASGLFIPPVINTDYHTYPYMQNAEDRIRFSATQLISATAYPDGGEPFELDIEGGWVKFDDSVAPRIQANLTCKIPADKSILDSLDSRRTFRVKIYAGYKWNSVEEDTQLLADLHVRERSITRPDNKMELECHSDESLSMDYRRLAWDSQPPQTNLLDAVAYHVLIATIGSELPDVVSDYPLSFGASAVSGLVQEPGQSGWDLILDSASRAGVSVYCDPDRTWRIAKPQELSPVTSLNLTTGGGGIIIDSNSVYSRDNFRNAVCIKYSWKDGGGVDQVVYGHAFIQTGPFSLIEIGYNSHYEERNVPATQAQADSAASAVLQAMSRRGRSFSVGAISAYWLRPGQTVTATLPEGEQERLLVSAVYFNFPSGVMSVRLRQPEDIDISNTN